MTSKSDCILRADRENKPRQNILAPYPIDGRGRSYLRAEIEVSHCPAGQSLAFSGAASGDKSVIRAGDALDAKTFLAIRRKAALEGCKWDIQVGDVTTLASFPLIINRSVWDQLAGWAEHLAEEAAEAENEVLRKPALLRLLGLPRPLEHVLADGTALTPTAGRITRFDFHFTTEGWRISEANSDVPGGFSEASHFTAMMAQQFPRLQVAGNPAEAWSSAIVSAAGLDGVVALLVAPGYVEDQQVTSFLAKRLSQWGCAAHVVKPEQICWDNGRAYLATDWHRGPVDAIVRFYQAEWLPRLARHVQWNYLLRGGSTPVANPAPAIISESKRFPLVWEHLQTRLLTWRALLPETRNPRQVNWDNEHWLLKTAMCNTGDAVNIRELMKPRHWQQTRLSVLLMPKGWVAQRRFESLPVMTPLGPRHVCIGVYAVNGRAAGAYARLAEKPLIDFSATDAALLIEEND